MKENELKVSDLVKKNVEEAIQKLAKELDREMTIASLDHVKVSIDFNRHSTGKQVGVKWSAFKFERKEFIYDMDVPNG